MTSDRMASSLARPPALRITWASPSLRPAYFAGSRRASIQVRIAKWRLGGNGRLPLSPKLSAYLTFAASTSSRILLIALAFCSELYEEAVLYHPISTVPSCLSLFVALRTRHALNPPAAASPATQMFSQLP